MSAYLTKFEEAYTRFNEMEFEALATHQNAARKTAFNLFVEYGKLKKEFTLKYDNQTLSFSEGLEIVEKVGVIREKIFDLIANRNTSEYTCIKIGSYHDAVKKGRNAIIERLEKLTYATH